MVFELSPNDFIHHARVASRILNGLYHTLGGGPGYDEIDREANPAVYDGARDSANAIS